MSKRLCQRWDCKHGDGFPAEGRWFVALLLVPSRGYTGKPWCLLTNAVVCDFHRDWLADSFITEDLWEQVLKLADDKGVARPHRTSTRAEFVSVDEVDVP